MGKPGTSSEEEPPKSSTPKKSSVIRRHGGSSTKTRASGSKKIPATSYLIRKTYRTYVAVDAPTEGKPLTAPAPPTIIENGFWGPGLLSEILCNRYLYHLPYDRQQKLYANRFGVHLPKQTMSDAALKVTDQLGLLTTLMEARHARLWIHPCRSNRSSLPRLQRTRRQLHRTLLALQRTQRKRPLRLARP